MMGMSGVSFWSDFGVLAGMLVSMNLAGYYLLRQRLSPNYAFRAIKVIGNFVKTKISSLSWYLYKSSTLKASRYQSLVENGMDWTAKYHEKDKTLCWIDKEVILVKWGERTYYKYKTSVHQWRLFYIYLKHCDIE